MVRFGSAILAMSVVALADTALAADGVIELNQTCATQTGCTGGDTPGFPITLTARGSYRLTSNLQVPNQNTNGIAISSDDISIDFNGFTLWGPNTVTVPGLACSLSGTGVGILATGTASGFAAMNGRVRGMGSAGIQLPSAQTVRIERMTLEGHCGRALELGTAAIVSQVQSRGNAGDGIRVNFGGLVRDSVVEWNRDAGIAAGANSVVTNNIVGSNGHDGIVLFSGGSVPGGLVIANSVQGSGWNYVTLGRQGDGVYAPHGVAVLLNNVSGNGGTGIDAQTTLTQTTGIGLNTTNANGQGGVSGGVTIGCNSTDATRTCP